MTHMFALWRTAAALGALLTVSVMSGASWAQATPPQAPTIDWTTVRNLVPGTEIVVTRKSVAAITCWFLQADESKLVVLEAVDADSAKRVRRVLASLGDDVSKVTDKYTVGDERRGAAVSGQGITDRGRTLARRLEVAREDVTAVWSPDPEQAFHQVVASFDQLPRVLRPGDTVFVTDRTGREVNGKVVNLSEASLVMRAGSQTRAFPPDGVTKIMLRKPDSLGDGAIKGAVIGGGIVGGLFAIACLAGGCSGSDAGWILLSVGLWTGVGAGIGVAIDAAVPGRKLLVYSPSTSPSAARVSISPILLPKYQGVAVRISF